MNRKLLMKNIRKEFRLQIQEGNNPSSLKELQEVCDEAIENTQSEQTDRYNNNKRKRKRQPVIRTARR
jgi:hypothetical protein